MLKLVAHRDVPLSGREAVQRFGLPRSGSTATTVARLAGDGHLVADAPTRSGWRVVDPFLGAWLREEA